MARSDIVEPFEKLKLKIELRNSISALLNGNIRKHLFVLSFAVFDSLCPKLYLDSLQTTWATMLQSLLYVASSLTANAFPSPDASIDPSTTSFVKMSVATAITGIICALQRGKPIPEEERASNRGLSAIAIILGEILFNSSISEGAMDSYTGAVVDVSLGF